MKLRNTIIYIFFLAFFFFVKFLLAYIYFGPGLPRLLRVLAQNLNNSLPVNDELIDQNSQHFSYHLGEETRFCYTVIGCFVLLPCHAPSES